MRPEHRSRPFPRSIRTTLYLIDGYNLLNVADVPVRVRSGANLEKAIGRIRDAAAQGDAALYSSHDRTGCLRTPLANPSLVRQRRNQCDQRHEQGNDDKTDHAAEALLPVFEAAQLIGEERRIDPLRSRPARRRRAEPCAAPGRHDRPAVTAR